MFGKHAFKFSWIPFAGKALWTRVVQCSFNCIHFHCCKIARWNMEQTQSTFERCLVEDTISVVQWVVWFAGSLSLPRSIPIMVHPEYVKQDCQFWKNNRTCVLKVEAIFETSHFSIKKHNSFSCRCFKPETSVWTTCRSACWAIVVQCWLVCLQNVCDQVHVLFSILDGSSAPVTCSCVPTKHVSQGLEHGRNPYSESELVVFRIHANQKKFRIFCQQIRLRFPV